jgi:hypothetical protein
MGKTVQGLKKSLPKRCVSVRLKERRSRSWAAGQARKRSRELRQTVAQRANVKLRTQGQPTAWEIACEQSVQRRATRVERGPSHAKNDYIRYNPAAQVTDVRGSESADERITRERYWRTLAKTV